MAAQAILASLLAVNNSATSATGREQATLALEAFKTQPNGLEHSLELYEVACRAAELNPQHRDLLRHFALCASSPRARPLLKD